VNGALRGDDEEERDRMTLVKEREREKERGVVDDAKVMAGPGVIPGSALPTVSSTSAASSPVSLHPPSKMSVPQMVDGP
jgi:hypothetical protein